MIVQSIIEALYAQYESSPLPAFVEGLFYAGNVPDETTGEYITYFQVSGTQEYTMSSRSEHPTFQFSVWSEQDSPVQCIAIAEQLMLWFDDCRLSVSGGHHVRIDRVSHNLLPDPDGGWQYQIDYSILVQEAD